MYETEKETKEKNKDSAEKRGERQSNGFSKDKLHMERRKKNYMKERYMEECQMYKSEEGRTRNRITYGIMDGCSE